MRTRKSVQPSGSGRRVYFCPEGAYCVEHLNFGWCSVSDVTLIWMHLDADPDLDASRQLLSILRAWRMSYRPDLYVGVLVVAGYSPVVDLNCVFNSPAQGWMEEQPNPSITNALTGIWSNPHSRNKTIGSFGATLSYRCNLVIQRQVESEQGSLWLLFWSLLYFSRLVGGVRTYGFQVDGTLHVLHQRPFVILHFGV